MTSMKFQVMQKDTMAVPDGRGGWLNPAVDASSSPVTLFAYRTLDDAEFKSIVNYEDNSASSETLPYEKNAPETQQMQINGTAVRGKDFWWPKQNDDAEDEDSSTMKDRKTGAWSKKPEKTDLMTRHEKSVQRRERRLLKMDLDQKEREAAYREEIHAMQMSVLQAEKRAHEAKCSYYLAKLSIVEPNSDLRRMSLP